jgi:Domain of unknown function (DUF4331)
MSSHREAPEISKDPVADSTDLYAFVSPDRPDTVTLIANYIPLEDPAGGPNFFEFGDDVQYRINIDNDGDGIADVIYEFRFTTEVTNPDTFLYNTGPIGSLDDPNWNRRQSYSVSRIVMKDRNRHSDFKRKVIGKDLKSPPCNIGPRSTPNYAALADLAVYPLPTGETVFAGQRLDGFFVDLGSIFDLGALRPFQNLHLIPSAAQAGVDALRAFSVHSIAIQVPIGTLTVDGSKPSDVGDTRAVIGVWTSASRRKASIRDSDGQHEAGPFTQVSRLGNPLFNEVIVPMGDKDRWNRLSPDGDSEFTHYLENPELAALLPVLYPGVFPNLAALNDSKKPRADLVAILLTGLPPGIIEGFQNFSGPTQADMLRLNVAVPPSATPSPFGILGGDLAGFPNGRRVADDIVAIELRAIAGATYGLVDNTFTADGAASLLTDGTTGAATFQPTFPYLDNPKSGYETVPLNVGAP